MAGYVGLDIGNESVKLAYDKSHTKLVRETLPENLCFKGEIISKETLADFLGEVRSKHSIKAKDCYLIVGKDVAYIRRIEIPVMSVDEIKLNLAYEFKDFIEGDPDEYVYDYLVQDTLYNEDKSIRGFDLFASAMKRDLIEDYAYVVNDAGFKLKAIFPDPVGYMRLLDDAKSRLPQANFENLLLVDMGHEKTVLSLYKDNKYQLSKTIDLAINVIDMVIAEKFDIDKRIASDYKFNNYEDVLSSSEVETIYAKILMEIEKVINFYSFSSGVLIDGICLTGGGAAIQQLVGYIKENVSVPVYTVNELLPSSVDSSQEVVSCSLALSALMEGQVM